MGTTAVKDRLEIPLPMVKKFLRLDDDILTTVKVDAALGATFIMVESPQFLIAPFPKLTIHGDVYMVQYVQYSTGEVGISPNLSKSATEETPIFFNAEDDVLLSLVEGAKEDADNLLNNPFHLEDGSEAPIPQAVLQWCLRHIARNYERRESGLTSENVVGLGGASISNEDEDESIYRYRLNPGL